MTELESLERRLKSIAYKAEKKGYQPCLTEVEFIWCEFQAAQRCQTCSQPFGSLSDAMLDHDHEFGHFRGFLCRPCNLALGMVEDNVLILENMINYLKEN